MVAWLAKLRKRSLAARGGALAMGVLAVFVLTAPVAGRLGGWAGLGAAAAAGGLCLAGAALALFASHVLQGPKYALYGMLLATGARMAIPLGFGLGCHLYGGTLAEAGLLYYLLVFYPVTLAVETALSLPPDSRLVSSSGGPGNMVS